MGTDFYLRDSGFILEGSEPGQVQSIQLCGSGRPDILLCIGVDCPGGEGFDLGKCLILLRHKGLSWQRPGRKGGSSLKWG